MKFRVPQVIDGPDNRKPCSDIRLKKELYALVPGNLFEPFVVGVAGRRGYLVGGDDGHSLAEEVLVQSGDLLAGGAVDEHGVENIHSYHFVTELVRSDGNTILKLFLPILQIQSVPIEQSLDTSGDSDHIDFEVVLVHEFLALALDLPNEPAPDGPNSAEEDVEFLIFRKEEAVVDDVQGFTKLAPIHQE